MKTSTVEAQPQVELRGRYMVAPEEVHGQLDLGNVGVGVHVAPNRIRRVPYSVQIIAHDVNKIHMLDGGEIEMPEVPEASGDRERDDISHGLLVVFIVEFFQECDEILAVVRMTAAVGGSRIFLFVLSPASPRCTRMVHVPSQNPPHRMHTAVGS